MKSWTVAGPHGVECLPENGSSDERLGEQRDLPGRDAVGRPLAVDGVGLRLVDHARRCRRRRGRRARRACASTGADVITGEAIRTRRRAPAIARAIACERSVPWPGVNQARPVQPPPRSTDAGLDPPRALDVAALPQLLEVGGEGRREGRGLERDDHVLLARPRVGGPVGRAGPARPRRRGPRTCGASGRERPGRRGSSIGSSCEQLRPGRRRRVDRRRARRCRRCRRGGSEPRARRRLAARPRPGRPPRRAGGCRRGRARASASRAAGRRPPARRPRRRSARRR